MTSIESNLFRRPHGLYHLLPLYAALRPQLEGRRVLEIDCGSGDGAALVAAGTAREVVGLNRDGERVDELQRTLAGPRLRFEAQLGDHLPFDDDSFDVVLAIQRPFDPFRSSLGEQVRRVMTAEGLFVASLPNPARANLPVPGSSAVPESVLVTAHQFALELRRSFGQVDLFAQSPVLGFLLHDLGRTEASLEQLDLIASPLGMQRLDEVYTWLALCSVGPRAQGRIPATLVRLGFDDLAEVLQEQREEGLEQADRVLKEDDRLDGFQERLEAIHEDPGLDDTAPRRVQLMSPGKGHRGDEERHRPPSPVSSPAGAAGGTCHRWLRQAAAELGGLEGRLEELVELSQRATRAQRQTQGALRLVEAERDRLSRELQEKYREVEELRKRSLRGAQPRDQEQRRGLEQALEERDGRIRVLEEQLHDDRLLVERLQERTAAAEAELERRGEELGEAQAMLEQERGRAVSTQATLDRLVQVVRGKQQQVVALEEQLADAQAAVQTLDARVQELKKIAQEAAERELADDREAERELLEQELRRIDEENARLRSELEATRKALQSSAGSAEATEAQRKRERAAQVLLERVSFLEDSLAASRSRVAQVASWVEGAMRQLEQIRENVR